MENGKFFTLHYGGLRTPPILCRPYGANHNSTLYTGVDTPAYTVSPLTGLIITLHSTLYTLDFKFFTLHFFR